MPLSHSGVFLWRFFNEAIVLGRIEKSLFRSKLHSFLMSRRFLSFKDVLVLLY